MRRLLGVLLLLITGALSYAQSADVNQLLSLLQSSDPMIWADAFYKLRSVGFGSSDAIKLGVINLLVAETAFADSPTAVPNDSGERYGAYFGDVTGAVASLHDVRAINALLGVIDTGDMVTRSLAGFGTTGLDAVITKGSNSDPRVRNGSAIALREMLELNTVADAASKGKIKTALNALAVDSDYFVGLAPIKGLATLSGIPEPALVKRVTIDINPDSGERRDGDRHQGADDRNDSRDDSERKAINPSSHDEIAVAILSMPTFDATSVDDSTVRFGPE